MKLFVLTLTFIIFICIPAIFSAYIAYACIKSIIDWKAVKKKHDECIKKQKELFNTHFVNPYDNIWTHKDDDE